MGWLTSSLVPTQMMAQPAETRGRSRLFPVPTEAYYGAGISPTALPAIIERSVLMLEDQPL